MAPSVLEFIRAQKSEYESRTVPVPGNESYSQYALIDQIVHYWTNRYIEDAHDDVIGDYPFDNIAKWRVLLEARATDFDQKHVEIEPEKPDRVTRVKAMISTSAARKRMDKIKFGKTINDICITRPKYGGVLVTNTDEGIFVVPWENVITDQSDVMAGPRIIRHYFTPSELLKKKGWKNLKDAVKTASEFRDDDMGANQEEAETLGHLIEVFEIQGDLPVSMIKAAQAAIRGEEYEYDEDEDYEYKEAIIFACGADWTRKQQDDNGKEYTEENGIVLYVAERPTTHKYLARNPMVGRGLGEGVVELLFEPQKWHNFTKTEEMRMIAIAGKKLYWTDDPDILSNIFNDGVDHGTVLRVSQGKTLQELNQLPTGVPIYQTIREEWKNSADNLTSSYNSKIGEEAKSGTPFRAQYLQNIEASSQFEQYREEIGFFLEEIVEDWILPDALKELADEDAIYASFTPQELQMIDEAILTETVNKTVVERILKDRKPIQPEEYDQIIFDAQTGLRRNGNKRYIKKVKDFIKDAGGSVRVHTTDEARNKAVYFESLGNALALLSPEDPRRNAIIDRIMAAIGIPQEELELYASGNMLTLPPGNPNPQLQTAQLAKTNQIGADLALAG